MYWLDHDEPNDYNEYFDLDLEIEDTPDMSDAALEAQANAAAREYLILFEQLPTKAKIKFLVERTLARCMSWRRTIERYDLPIFRSYLQASQRELVRLRKCRRLGLDPRKKAQ